MKKKINIAIAGGPCTGKSTLAASTFAVLKILELDYDLIGEESRRLKKEFGQFTNVFERFYMWRQQEREELRSNASDGFITDQPLFHFYVQAKQYAKTSRDQMAVRELYRMCLEIPEERYNLIVMVKDWKEIKYKKDSSRSAPENEAKDRHEILRRFTEHLWPRKLLYVSGNIKERTHTVVETIYKLKGQGFPELPNYF